MRFCLKYLKKFSFVCQFITVHFCVFSSNQNSSSRMSNVTFSCIQLISLEDHTYTGVFRRVRTIYCINLCSILNASKHSLSERTSYKSQPKWEEMQEYVTPSMSLMVSMSDVIVRPVPLLKRLMRQSVVNKVRPSHCSYQVQRRKLEKVRTKRIPVDWRKVSWKKRQAKGTINTWIQFPPRILTVILKSHKDPIWNLKFWFYLKLSHLLRGGNVRMP